MGAAGLLCILALTLALAAFSLHDVLFAPGQIYQNWDQTIPPLASQIRVYGSISADSWSSIYELGSPATFNGISWVFDQLMRKGPAFLGGPALAKGYFLLYALLGAAGFGLLARRLGLSFWPTLLVCLLSQFGPRTYSLVVSGHEFESGFALTAAPWMLLGLDLALAATGRARMAALCGAALAAGLGSSSSPFGIVFVGVFLLLWTLGALAAERSSRPLLAAGFVCLALVTLHLHWLAPAAFSGTGGAKYNQRLEDVRAHYESTYRRFSAPPAQAMIGHTDNLGMGTEYAYPVAPPRDAWWKPSAYALAALALLGALYRGANPALARFAAASLFFGFLMMAGAQTTVGRLLYEGLLARVSMVFFLMARPARWLPFHQAGLALMAGMGLEAVRRRRFWTGHRWPYILAVTAALVALAVYLEPWWAGELTRPKNATTQTMALTPQPVSQDESRLVRALNRDPGDYRITVLPTISGPTGHVPAPPATSLTRNFGLTGKDSLVGPAFVGQPYGRFLLSLAHRRAPSTDHFGRLAGLGAVRRVFFDSSAPYLSYMDFGWMPAAKRGAETLADPRGVLTPFLAAQADLVVDPAWTFGPILGFDNADALPRIRLVKRAALAGGGFPLLAALAELPENPAAQQALFFAADVSAAQAEALAPVKPGRVTVNGAWPELLLPFAPDKAWTGAWTGTAPPPAGWTAPGDGRHRSLWFESSPLDGGLLVSSGPAELALPLPGAGPHRLLARVASLPGQHGADIAYNGRLLAEAAPPTPLDRGWRWLDLGVVNLDGVSPLVVRARGRGAAFAGTLCLSEADFARASAELDRTFAPDQGLRELWTAPACAAPQARAYAAVQEIPLLADRPGLARRFDGLRVEGLENTGLGVLAAEGDGVGRAEFAVELPPGVGEFSLECYPRLFGDPGGLAFARGEWSVDGRDYHPLFETAPKPDGKWEDVYGRRIEAAVRLPGSAPSPRGADASPVTLRLRFTLRQAQLTSLGNPPNQPMRLVARQGDPLPGAPTLGQGVFAPADLVPVAREAGVYRVGARLLTPEGPLWVDLGRRRSGPGGRLPLVVDGPPGSACDLVALDRCAEPPPGAAGAPSTDPAPGAQARTETPGRAFTATPTAPDPARNDTPGEQSEDRAPPGPAWRRDNQGRYLVEGLPAQGGILVFSESYHSRWLARWRTAQGPGQAAPLPAYGFANAYLLGPDAPESLRLEFAAQPVRERFLLVSLAAWGALGAAFVVSLVLAAKPGFYSGRKQARHDPTP